MPPVVRSSRLDWLLFVLLGFFWGSSYLFIKIGVEAGIKPLTLVTLRLAFGALLLGGVVALARERLPRAPRTYGHLVVIAVLSVALPFSLVSWAEQSVDSTLAAVINGAIPLFVMVIAAATLPDEPFTVRRVAGLLVGFVGVAILVGFDPGVVSGTGLLPALALMGSSLSYAAGGVYARRFLQGLRPMITALFEIGFALVIAAVLAGLVDRPLSLPGRLDALVAVVWLGLLGSGLAFLIFFRLLGRWGATRASMVAYLIPVFGLLLGALVLREPIDARLLIGTVLVIGGIALVNLRLRSSRRRVAPMRGVEPSAPSEPGSVDTSR
ncbi:MAG: EamA family transporter [Chloroflexi bacterium]|nr:MAG: EamA family transporter [Chloroflexota bacterium]